MGHADDDESEDERPPYWLLISVLFSSVPLTAEAAWTLYDAAIDLIHANEDEAALHSDAVSGTLRSLGKHVVMGSIGGPAFEAEVSTPEHEDATVRFLVTRQGVDLAEARRLAHVRQRRRLN